MNLLGHPAIVAEDDDFTDSRVYNRTPYNFGEVILLASRNWSQLSESIQEAWSTRATRLNSRPVPGLFLQVPDDINNNILLQSINSEWEVLVANLKRCIVRPPRRRDSILKRCFGKEVVKIGAQVLRVLNISVTLQTVIFGNDHSKLQDSKLIFNSKKRVLIHIASRRRMEELFTNMGQCGVTFEKDNILFCCSGKVSLKNRNNKNVVGFVVNET